MKKQSAQRGFNPDIIGMYSNIARIYEISKVGNHSISFCYYNDKDDSERNVNPKDIQYIVEFYGSFPHKNGEILCEVVRISFEEIMSARKYETLEDINYRIETTKNFPKPELESMNEACYSLLKTAYERLNFCLYDVITIREVAQTIARMAFSETIKIEHIAEAIQYRALINSDKVKIYDI